MKLRLLRQENDKCTWKQKTLDPSKTYIIHKGKCYEVPKESVLKGYRDTFIMPLDIEALEEVK